MTRILLIAMRGRDSAKQRLAPLFTEDERMALAWVMCRRLIDEARRAEVFGRIVIVTRDVDAVTRHIPASPGVSVVGQSAIGLNAGLQEVADGLRADCPASLTMVPADLPLVQSDDLAGLALCDDPIVLVPDRADRGTNGITIRGDLVGRFRFAMGSDSLDAHIREATSRGVQARIHEIPRLAHDLDSPNDWADLSPMLQRSYLEAMHQILDTEARVSEGQ